MKTCFISPSRIPDRLPLHKGKAPALIVARLFALWLPLGAAARESATPGSLPDGETPPPLSLPEFTILGTEEARLGKRKLILHRVENPGLPDPTPPPAAPNPSLPDAIRDSPEYQAARNRAANTAHLFLSATVVDRRATLLRWWEDGKACKAWSNIDFRYLAGFNALNQDERQFVVFLGITEIDSRTLPDDSSLRIPADLPQGSPEFKMIQGAANDTDGYAAVAALHRLDAGEGEQLREAYERRETQRREAEAERLANPPPPGDIVLHFWKVEPPGEPEPRTPRQAGPDMKGGAK